MLIIQGCLLFLFWYPIMTALATGHSSLTQYVRRCAILTGVTAISDCTTLGFMIIFLDKAPIPLLATVYVSYLVKGVVVEILLKQFRRLHGVLVLVYTLKLRALINR